MNRSFNVRKRSLDSLVSKGLVYFLFSREWPRLPLNTCALWCSIRHQNRVVYSGIELCLIDVNPRGRSISFPVPAACTTARWFDRLGRIAVQQKHANGDPLASRDLSNRPALLPPRFRAAIKAILRQTRDGGHVHASAPALLDREYAQGRWDYLESLQEGPRYAVISGYCAYRRSAVSVLDLGCGAGVLRRWLHPEFVADYVGIDASRVAIQRAHCKAQPLARFVAADIALYEPDRRFDVIVFNEVLYYFADPAGIVRRYANALESDGVFVISLWAHPDADWAWRQVEPVVEVADAVEVRSARNLAWRIRLCRPTAS